MREIKGFETLSGIMFCMFEPLANTNTFDEYYLSKNIPVELRKHIIGHAVFLFNYPYGNYYSIDTYVEPRYRRQKVASQIYDFAEKQINIIPSKYHTQEGLEFWEYRNSKLINTKLNYAEE